MNRQKNRQKGVMLVFTAIMLPIIFILCGLVYDLGYMYVQKSKLQHAADAAVLAGGYTYVADWDDPDKRTQVLNSMKKYLNSDIDNGQIEKVVYRFKDNDEAQGVMISLYAKKDTRAIFTRMFGYDLLPVHVVATCKLSGGSVTPGGDNIYNYAIIGGQGELYQDWTGNRYRESLIFQNTNIHIVGQVHTDGSVYIDDNVADGARRVLVDPGQFSTSKTSDAALWTKYRDLESYEHFSEPEGKGLYDNDQRFIWYNPYAQRYEYRWRHYARIGEADGSQYGKDIVASEHYAAPLDIEANSSGAAADLYNKIVQWANMSSDERKANGIYLASEINSSNVDQIISDNDNKYSGWQYSHQLDVSRDDYGFHVDWTGDDTPYRIIVADGNLSVNLTEQFKNETDSAHTILISLHGNIQLNNHGDAFHGILYAPHGEVWITGDKPVVGTVVGNAIRATQNGVSIIWKDWEHAGGSGGGGGTGSPSFVRLTEDVDDRYVVQP